MMHRNWLFATWVAAAAALICASLQGSMGIAALWAFSAAVAVTVACMGWPEHRYTRTAAMVGVAWELALIGAYWPFSSEGGGSWAPATWPMHAVLIAGVLLLFMMAFVAFFVIPAVQLHGRLSRATAVLADPSFDFAQKISAIFVRDQGLRGAWQQHQAQLRDVADSEGRVQPCARVGARELFDLPALTHSRLRLDFFRNLPSVLTGIGIIGTFAGLIMGLKGFRITADPTVAQRSLEALLGGVWLSFLVSSAAIVLAMVATVVEKILLSTLAGKLDDFTAALDNQYPPRPQTEGGDWAPQLLQALRTLPAAAIAAPAALPASEAQSVHTQPLRTDASAPTTSAPVPWPAPAAASEETWSRVAADTRSATTAMAELAQALPQLLTQSLQTATQSQAQAAQALKQLATRMEGVAGSIEMSGRKTIESVGARLMQSEMAMNNRNHAVAEHLGELVQRIETLCGLLQQDRNSRVSDNGDDFGGDTYDQGFGRSAAPAGRGRGGDDGFGYSEDSNGFGNGFGHSNGNGFVNGANDGGGRFGA
jgi:hypothetical protein